MAMSPRIYCRWKDEEATLGAASLQFWKLRYGLGHRVAWLIEAEIQLQGACPGSA